MGVQAELSLKSSDVVTWEGRPMLQLDVNLQIPLADLVNTMVSTHAFGIISSFEINFWLW